MAAFKLSELPPQMIARMRAAERAVLGLSPVGAGDDKGREPRPATGRTGANKTEALYRDDRNLCGKAIGITLEA